MLLAICPYILYPPIIPFYILFRFLFFLSYKHKDDTEKFLILPCQYRKFNNTEQEFCLRIKGSKKRGKKESRDHRRKGMSEKQNTNPRPETRFSNGPPNTHSARICFELDDKNIYVHPKNLSGRRL